MTEPEDEPAADFPDVRISAPKSLGALSLLAAIYAGLFVGFGTQLHQGLLALLVSLGLGASLLLLSYIDMRTGLLPDVLTLPLIVFGAVHAVWFAPPLWQSVLGAGVGYGLVAGLAFVWRRYRQYEGLGLGDAKLLAAGGAWLGISLLPMVLLVASGLGLLSALTVSQKTRKASERVALPFGPFLGLGIWACWCAGELIF